MLYESTYFRERHRCGLVWTAILCPKTPPTDQSASASGRRQSSFSNSYRPRLKNVGNCRLCLAITESLPDGGRETCAAALWRYLDTACCNGDSSALSHFPAKKGIVHLSHPFRCHFSAEIVGIWQRKASSGADIPFAARPTAQNLSALLRIRL